ncbi:MAG: ribonuclease Y [Candidatus Kerfeldbacteria bacterium]|nr:ribonuclease Y [Candidatus Kerfeldbacteria bacterium]
MATSIWIILAAVGIPAAAIAGYFLRKSWATREAASVEAKASNLLAEAKAKQKQILLEAQEQALKVLQDAKKDEEERRRELNTQRQRLEQREQKFDEKILEIEKSKEDLAQRAEKADAIKKELERIREEQFQKLEKIAELTREEAKTVLLNNTENSIKDELVDRIKKLQQTSYEELEKESKKLLSTALQRVASSHAAETTTTVVPLPSDDLKGRIIGKEGRNIKTIEQLTGVEIIVDDTPESIIVSGFSLIRRHIAKRALEKLMADGRIHPARIEEAVEQAKKDMAIDIKKAGEEAAREVGIVGLDPKLIQILGRLKYRTSYGQNVLRHSVEVAILAGVLADELGANSAVAKKGGLLHDIGKAIDHEVQGTHTQLGYDIMRKFGLPEEVAYIAIAHHEDSPRTFEGVIAKVADAMSGARPGARKDTYEQYVQRLEELEGIAKTFDGVDKVYAIQAGREMRVFVMPEKVDDLAAIKLARDIANQIESQLQYPGEIKVTLIREKRVIEYAR